MNRELRTFQENVQRLKTMTAKFADQVLDPDCSPYGPPKIYLLANGGEAKVYTLHERETVSIAKAYVTPNGVFPDHKHFGIEVIVVFEGSARYESQDSTKLMLPGQCVSVPRDKPHRVIAGPQGAWFSVTLVPREEGLGNVR